LNSKEMYSYLPETKIKITESGLKNQEDLRAMAAIGFEGALIGESILKNTDPKSFIQNLNPNVVYAH
jgi:indole-3-glycerol phosphate synthase